MLNLVEDLRFPLEQFLRLGDRGATRLNRNKFFEGAAFVKTPLVFRQVGAAKPPLTQNSDEAVAILQDCS